MDVRKLTRDQRAYIDGEPNSFITTVKEDGTSSSGSTSTTAVNAKLASTHKDTLKKYDEMDADQRKQWFNTENDAEFKYAAAKFENDLAEGKISKIQEIGRRKSLAKEEIGSKFSKEVRDLYYQLGKADLYDYVTKAKNGQQLADDLLAYDQALYDAGLTTYGSLKFKNGLAPQKGGRKGGTKKASAKGRKSGGGSAKGTKQPNANSENITTTANVTRRVANAKVAKRQLPKTGGVRGASIKAYKKPTKTNVAMRRA
jgi:hypothetical protein